MKKFLFLFVIILAFASSCKKDSFPQVASLNVINASVNVATAQVNYFNTPSVVYATLPGVGYGSNIVFSPGVGTTSITINSKVDSTQLIYNTALNANAGDIYSLFIAGQSTAVDNILVKDNLPYHGFTDSTCGVRFINLSYNSTPVSVTLSTTPATNEFSTVAYKSITDFKTYSATVAASAITFQVRDAANTILVSFVFTSATIPRFYNCTLALIGQIGATGANAPKLIRINNY